MIVLLALSVISHQSHRLGTSSYRIFDEQGGSIGRGQNNEWVLDDPTCQLSSRHLTVRAGEGCFVVEDTSSNGTGLNGREALLPRGQRVPIADGDRLYLADFEILVQVVERVAPAGNSREIGSRAAARAQASPDTSDATQFGDAPPKSAAAAMARVNGALGLPHETADEAPIAEFASVLKIVTRGVLDLLLLRGQVTERFALHVDDLGAGHNPFRLHRSVEAVLHDMFGSNDAGSVSPIEAFSHAFATLIQHHGAMLAGMRAAPHPLQFGEAFARAYHDHIRQLNDATIVDNP